MIQATIHLNPISTNALYFNIIRNGRIGFKVLTKQGKEFKEQFKKQYQEEVTAPAPAYKTERLYIKLLITFGTQRPRDLDNCLKAILDALEGLAYTDDNQLDQIHISRGYEKNKPSIKIEIGRTDLIDVY